MSLPTDRTKLGTAISNQQPSQVASAQANREALISIYDQTDELYNFTSGLVAGGVLQPYPFGAYRQSVINGGFNINQRVVSGTVVLTAGKYGHDRWKAGAGGCTYTFATINNVTTITITAGALVQVIEGINLYSGTYTLSWTGTAQGKIGSGSYGATGITGTIVGGTNTSIEFGVGTLSKVQFNFGNVAIPFQPRSYADELQLCQRYCVDLYGSYRMAFYQPTFMAFSIQYLTNNMRVNPSLVISGVETTDYVVATTSYGPAGSGWALSVSTSALVASKSAHGLTDGIVEIKTKGKVLLDAEL